MKFSSQLDENVGPIAFVNNFTVNPKVPLAMTKTTTNSKVASKNVLQPIIIGVALIVNITVSGVPKATALDQIHSSRQISASVDRVWNIITNLGNDTTWNQVNTMKVIKKTGNTIEADITVGPINARSYDIISFHPKQSTVTNVTQGPITGSRVVTLSPLSANRTNIDVLWNIDTSGVLFFVKGFAEDRFTAATEDDFSSLSSCQDSNNVPQ